MTTTTHNPTSFSRFSRLTFGLGLKSTNGSSSSRAVENELDEEWYIPYSGPVEPPREPVRRLKERDSWGDPIEGEDEEDEIALASIELHKRYELGSASHHSVAGNSQLHGVGSDASKTGHRARVQSGVSGRTVSSGIVDPSRASVVPQRRSTVAPSLRLQAPLTASGGVGESPMPPAHRRSSSKDGNRTSIVGLFSFGGQARNRTPSFLGKKTAISAQPAAIGHRRSSSTGSNSLLGRGNLRNGGPEHAGADEYYSSYYFSSNLRQKTESDESPPKPIHPYVSASVATHRVERTSLSSASGSDARHPYSYVFPTSSVSSIENGPQTAPLPHFNPVASTSRIPDTPKLTFTMLSQKPASATMSQAQFSLPRSFPFYKGRKQLKNSTSTPDLRLVAASSPNLPSRDVAPQGSTVIKTKDRWLSAETWCDALLFPRPRLRMKTAVDESNTGRIVSLPPSPILRGPVEQQVEAGVSEQGVASRVLAHSRSITDLSKRRANPSIVPGPLASALPSQQGKPYPPIQADRAPRPKSWALDDLALPTPVPSLDRVLEEGEILDAQRKQWQDQATNSFQNRLTRSISRSRSKSLSQKGRKQDSNIGLLAAKAYLGSQLLTPAITDPKVQATQFISPGVGPSHRSSHSHSNSLSKTWSKSSKSHSRGHSRSDSLGRAVLRKAKPLGRSWTGNGEFITDNELENALRRDDTKVIRLTDPAMARDPTPITSSSPTPPGSLASDARIGIALTTPPLVDNPVDVEAMRLPPHPYARGGLYSVMPSHVKKEDSTNALDYVVPDPPEPHRSERNNTHPLDLPSHQNDGPMSVSYHPYAQPPPSRSSYLPDTKFTYNDIPTPSKMWAQLSPGLIREVHPDDIQYSPFMSENGDGSETSSRNSRAIYDTVGVGEALAYAVHPQTSKGSGSGTSDGHVIVDPRQLQATALENYRQPVQYDATRPPHLLHEKRTTDPDSAHIFASSPLFHQQHSSPPDVPRHDSYDPPSVRTTSTSPDSLSPPHSPRSFGNPDDIQGFYDLFYNPNRPSRRMAASSGSVLGSRNGAGALSKLARQLSEEFERMTSDQEDTQYSHASTGELQNPITRKPTGSTLEFVFEETSSPSSATTGLPQPGQSTMSPFQPSSIKIPEDVESSRASSPLALDNDTERLCVGVVGSISTPPIVDGDHRSSYTGQMSSPIDATQRPGDEHDVEHVVSPQPRIISGLLPPSADPTRSSYMTTSTVSRMSGLSDFPAPPQRHADEHMSILTSYFDGVNSLNQHPILQNTTPPPMSGFFGHTSAEHSDDQSTRLTFGVAEEEMDELIATLSSHSHSTARH